MGDVPRYDTDRFTAMDKWHTVQCAAHLELLDEIRAKDIAQDWECDGASSMANWLVNRYNISRRTASDWVRVAHSLQELPALRAAYAAGRISWDQLRAVTRTATPDTDDDVAAEAPSLSISQLREKSRELSVGEVERIHRDRSFTWSFDEEKPILRFSGAMVDADGVELVKTITRMAIQAPPEEDGTYQSFEARCLDAMLQLASQQRGADSDPDRATAVIHIPLSVLTDDEGRAESESGTTLLAETARRLVCDARLQLNLESPDGTVIGVGRTTRTIPPWLARVIRMRDKGCRFPGCGRTRWIHFHHIIHWANGGPTDLDNLISLCLFHHRLAHEGGWSISGNPNGKVSWIRPGGSEFIPGWRYMFQCRDREPYSVEGLLPERFKTPDLVDTS